MNDNDVINMYKRGFSINYISKRYYKFKNKNSKPVKLDNTFYFPPKVYTMDYCRLYVSEVIYKYLQMNYQSTSIA